MSSKHQEIIPLLERAVLQLVEQTCQKSDWGINRTDNAGLAFDISCRMDLYEDEIRHLKTEYTEREFIIHATIGPTITTWDMIRGAIYRVLGEEAEQFMVITQTRDKDALKFWFAIGRLTGNYAHGHFGVISIPMEDIKHLDLNR